MRRLGIAVALAGAFALTGCTETNDERNLRHSIECHEAGGQWTLVQEGSSWANGQYVCDFSEAE